MTGWRSWSQSRYSELAARYPNRPLAALFALVNGFVSIAVMAAAALITHTPMIFPSLGPTAFLFFFVPLAPQASPRNTIFGHAIGAAAGWGSLAAFRLLDAEPAITAGVTGPCVLAAATSLGATAGLMVLLGTPHPPAGATTLIVAPRTAHRGGGSTDPDARRDAADGAGLSSSTGSRAFDIPGGRRTLRAPRHRPTFVPRDRYPPALHWAATEGLPARSRIRRRGRRTQ